MPSSTRTSWCCHLVRATDDEWFKICRMGHERGMMKVVADDLIPRDRMGHLITSGAGAVRKEKLVDGQRVRMR